MASIDPESQQAAEGAWAEIIAKAAALGRPPSRPTSAYVFDAMKQRREFPAGFYLVTGGTGSGKSVTTIGLAAAFKTFDEKVPVGVMYVYEARGPSPLENKGDFLDVVDRLLTVDPVATEQLAAANDEARQARFRQAQVEATNATDAALLAKAGYSAVDIEKILESKSAGQNASDVASRKALAEDADVDPVTSGVSVDLNAINLAADTGLTSFFTTVRERNWERADNSSSTSPASPAVLVIDSVSLPLRQFAANKVWNNQSKSWTKSRSGEATMSGGMQPSDISFCVDFEALAIRHNIVIFGIVNDDLVPFADQLEGMTEGIVSIVAPGVVATRNRNTRQLIQFGLAMSDFDSGKAFLGYSQRLDSAARYLDIELS